MATIERLKELLNEPVTFKLPDEDMDSFFALMSERHYMAEEFIITEGTVNDNVYILREGIIRGLFDKDEDRETTIYFGIEGDYFFAMNPFLESTPSQISVQACTDCTVMVISKESLRTLSHQSINFANWALENSLRQILALEMKRKFLKGNAMARYRSLIERRPEIVCNVPLKHIASYLGVTQQSLSRLRSSKYKP